MSDTKFYLSKENAKTLVDGVKQNFSPISHTHTKGDIEDLNFDSSLSSTSTNAIQNKTVTSSLNSKVPTSRTINGKALTNNITLNATDVQADPSGSASSALASAKTYADSVGASVKNDLLNGAGLAYDTLKELGDLIVDNTDAIEALETIASGKANASHTHVISDVVNLQSALDGKAASSHGTHVTFSTTAPVMDGTASVGSASTVARSDHKHPIDTSRAAQTSLDSHTSNKSNPHNVTLAQLGLNEITATEVSSMWST